MRLVLIIILTLISGCDDSKIAIVNSNDSVVANKLLSHGYRKYTYKQFGSANKAYLEAFFLYKDTGIKPAPQLYLGFSALLIQRLNEIRDIYPITGKVFIIDDEKEIIIHNKIELLNISLKYLLEAKRLSKDSNVAEVKLLNEIIFCHESYISGKLGSCRLIDEKLISFKLD